MPIYTKRANKTSDFIAFLSLNRSFSIFHESEEKKIVMNMQKLIVSILFNSII